MYVCFPLIALSIIAATAQLQVLYRQPKDNIDPTSDSSSAPLAGRVFANPKPWPSVPKGSTASVFWQRGNSSPAIVATPFYSPRHMDLDALTGAPAGPNYTAACLRSGSTHPVPFSAVSYSHGVFGAFLNTTGCDNTIEHLSTTTLESTFPSCFPVWSSSRTLAVQIDLDLAVPSGFRIRPNDNSCAIYVSLSLYFHADLQTSNPKFVWYSAPLYDLGRNIHNDHVFIDTSSKKLIVSGPVLNSSSYVTALPGTATSSNSTFGPTPRHFSYKVTSSNIEAGIRDGLNTFPEKLPGGLPKNASQWCVSGFNIELEATPGAWTGMALSGTTISITE